MSWFKKIAMPIYDVYHGTGDSESIYNKNFSYEYLGTGNDEYGPGFYFTNDKSTASRYVREEGNSPGIIRAKVNLSKPFQISGTVSGFFEKFPILTKDQISHALDHSLSLSGDDFLFNWGDVEYEGRENIIRTIINEYSGKSLMSVIYDFFHDPIEGLKYIKNQFGYDGIVVSFNDNIKIIVAWFPTQISIERNELNKEDNNS